MCPSEGKKQVRNNEREKEEERSKGNAERHYRQLSIEDSAKITTLSNNQLLPPRDSPYSRTRIKHHRSDTD